MIDVVDLSAVVDRFEIAFTVDLGAIIFPDVDGIIFLPYR